MTYRQSVEKGLVQRGIPAAAIANLLDDPGLIERMKRDHLGLEVAVEVFTCNYGPLNQKFDPNEYEAMLGLPL